MVLLVCLCEGFSLSDHPSCLLPSQEHYAAHVKQGRFKRILHQQKVHGIYTTAGIWCQSSVIDGLSLLVCGWSTLSILASAMMVILSFNRH